MIRYFLLLFCIMSLIRMGYAQYEESDFVRYSVREGLDDNSIGCLHQDPDGYVWIGTETGLNRYDGHTFTSYFQGTPPLYLPSGSIRQLKTFGPHHIGILSRGGFQLLDIRNYTSQSFRVPDSTVLGTQLNASWDAVQFPDSSFAVSTAGGFYVYDPQGQITFRYDAFTVEDIGKKRILWGRDIFPVSDHQYLLYIEDRYMAEYDHHTKSLRRLDGISHPWTYFEHPKLSPEDHWILKQQISPNVFVFIPTEQDVIVYYNHQTGQRNVSPLPFPVSEQFSWESRIEMINDSTWVLSHRNKGFYLLRVDPRTRQIQCDGKRYLSNYKILSFLADKDERLWIGTTNGLLKQKLISPVISAYKYTPEPGEQNAGNFTTVYRYKDILYAGRFSGAKGLTLIRAQDMVKIKDIHFYEGTNAWNAIRSIEMYHPDTLWIGTNTGLLWFDTKTETYGQVMDQGKFGYTFNAPILSPVRKDGYAWMCALLGGMVIRYHVPTRTFTLYSSLTKPALPFDRVKSIVYDAYGDVWIGGHSLARWNHLTEEFDTLITVYGGANPFYDDIVSLSADTEGSLWLHNLSNGILEYRIKEKKFIPYTLQDGLPTLFFQSLSLVKDHALWMAGNHQLALLDTRRKKITVYGPEDGLPEEKPTGRRIYHDESSGLMYLCSQDYISVFPMIPAPVPDHSSDLILEEVVIDNSTTHFRPEDGLNIKYNENAIRLIYTLIDFDQSQYQFAYRLNQTGSWNALGAQRSISLSNLSPGNYTLEVRASGKPGIEKLHTFHFVIHSPFWKTNWFLSLVFLGGTIGLYFLVRRRIRYIRQKANIDKLLLQTEMKALQAQMNPHFIFNSLNSIGEMILNGENKDASHFLSKFARLIRITLDHSAQTMVSLRHTIDYLERYMEMENIRNSLFTHEILLDPALDQDETMVPPLFLQPFIENAIWHGVTAQRKNIHVRIEFKKSGDHLACIIDDNGIGLFQAQQHQMQNGRKHQPMAISNIQNRMHLLNEKYHLHGHIEILDKKEIPGLTESGTRVTLHLPLDIDAS